VNRNIALPVRVVAASPPIVAQVSRKHPSQLKIEWTRGANVTASGRARQDEKVGKVVASLRTIEQLIDYYYYY
jgi:hypothetical protein